MRKFSVAGWCGAFCLLISGCLSLGGTTTYQEDPQTQTRLNSLEFRVQNLEQSRAVGVINGGTTKIIAEGIAP